MRFCGLSSGAVRWPVLCLAGDPKNREPDATQSGRLGEKKMSDIWTIGLPILALDITNPVLLAAVILALTTDKPYATSLAVIAGHTAAYFAAGLVFLFGIGELLAELSAPVQELLDNPDPSDFVISALVGFVLLGVALAWRVNPPKPSENQPEQPRTSLVSTFLFGAVISFIGIPFAVPYFAFISQLMKLNPAQSIPPLVIYNLGYAAVFLLVPLALAVFGEAIMPFLQRISAWVENAAAYVMPVLLGLLGLALLADAGLYFVTGTGLI
jgi:cytochrome c biogenesis protein CcdA